MNYVTYKLGIQNAYFQIDTYVFAKLMSLNSAYFDLKGSVFSKQNMSRSDKMDADWSRDGSGRVAIYKLTGLTHW